MHLFDLQQAFFIPVWRRILLIVFCLAWGIIEFVTGEPFWGIIFGGMGLYAWWQLFLDDWPKSIDDSKSTTED